MGAGAPGAAGQRLTGSSVVERETWCRGRLRSFALIPDLGEVLSSDDWLSDVPVPSQPIRVLPVDLDMLSSFLEGDPSTVEGGVIDLQTGDVIPRGDYFEDEEGIFDEDGEADPDRYLWFNNSGSRDAWQDMAEFAATVSDEPLRDRLDRALHGRSAFRRFRDIVHDADLGREFHAFADERLRARALEFLHDANIWLPDEQPPARREESDE